MLTTLVSLLAMSTKPYLSPAFGEHMVLQRERPNPIWGWTTPGQTVTVKVGDETASGTADASGKWMATLNPPHAGGPYTMTISGPAWLEFHDILVGDVWLCSGQSNMEMGVGMSKDADANIAAADIPEMRLMLTEHQAGYTDRDTPTGRWKVCTPATIKEGGWNGFSAVAYHFGKKLHRDLGVPVGLIQAAWGGSAAECWVSDEKLKPLHDFDEDLTMIHDRLAQGKPENWAYYDNWLEDHDPGSSLTNGAAAAAYDDSAWTDAKLPIKTADQGFHHDRGAIWLRNHFKLDRVPDDPTTIHFGRIVGNEAVWLNGKLIVDWGGDWDRWYTIPRNILKVGDNVLAIRHLGFSNTDGFLAENGKQVLDLYGKPIPLNTTWKMMKGAEFDSVKEQPRNWDGYPKMPTVLRHGMISPLAPLAIRGALWYQGETNADRGREYRALLPALIHDWREAFHNPHMPFYIVSLAGFTEHRHEPGDDAWAELREAQWMTSQTVGHSGIAMAVDVGDAMDIHPKDKQTVGERLADVALADEFGKKIPFSGPMYTGAHFGDGEVTLNFKHTDGGLELKGPMDEAFQLCGDDHKWVWGTAKLDGDHVVVTSDKVAHPVALRYAWQGFPQTPLYNKAGFPAVPFRTDDK